MPRERSVDPVPSFDFFSKMLPDEILIDIFEIVDDEAISLTPFQLQRRRMDRMKMNKRFAGFFSRREFYAITSLHQVQKLTELLRNDYQRADAAREVDIAFREGKSGWDQEAKLEKLFALIPGVITLRFRPGRATAIAFSLLRLPNVEVFDAGPTLRVDESGRQQDVSYLSAPGIFK